MSVTAKRFEFLNQETNVATSDFYKSDNSSILNSPNMDMASISAMLEGFLGNSKQKPDMKSMLSSGAVSSLLPTRTSKDGQSSFLDVSNLPTKDITSMLSRFMPGNTLAVNDMQQMSSFCRNRALGRGYGGKPYSPFNLCNGNRRSSSSQCGSGPFGSAMSRMTNGAYSSSYNNPNDLLSSILSLSGMGMDMSMCGVFTALSAGVSNLNLLSRASGLLMGKANTDRNVFGMMDIAGASGSLSPLLQNPSAVTGMLSGFTMPSEVRQRDTSSLANRFTGAMEIVNPNWSRSSYDDTLSNSGVNSYQMSDLMRTRALDNVYPSGQLNVAPTDDFSFLSLAF